MSDVTPSVSSSAWQREGFRGFSIAAGESLADAVRRDLDELLSRQGELPTPERYLDAVDPVRDRDSLVAIVLAAFDAAPRFRRELGAAWRARHPSWADAIQRAAALAVLGEGIEVEDAEEVNSDLAAPTRLGPPLEDGEGRYELLEPIGKGSSGAVHRALDRSLARCGSEAFVAVKRIRCDAAEVDARLREAGAARTIAHAGVARVLDAGRDANGVFIVTELIAGVPLYIWKALAPDRSAEECERIVALAQDALLACHARGVAHGDLSPANLMIDAEGAPRIVDFGHASWGRESDGAGVDHADSAARDHRRLAGILRWLLRGIDDGAALRRAAANIARVSRGESIAVRTGRGARALAVAAASACAVVIVLWFAFVAGDGVDAGQAAERTPAQAAKLDPLAEIFGASLASRPELERVVRELLRDGVVGIPVESLEEMRAALRAEASALVERPASDPADGVVLLASALLALTGDDIDWSAPFAVLAAERDAGNAPRVLLAQAIVDIARARSGGEEALAVVRERLVAIRTQCGATGLDVVAENVARFTPPSTVPPDAIRRPARS
ncbi:MAG: protein kinase [Phycisphaera sp.]|nr:protein kinase [Phycisphaera sp.]